MKEENNIKHQIFYLLGAGASVMQDKYSKKACLPLANDFVEKIEKLKIEKIDIHEFPTKTKYILDKIDVNINGLNQSISNFLEEISKFGTIDEAMRYYYLNNNTSQFNEFKHIISCIFYIFENIEQFRDPRYKQFLMTLIKDKEFKLPENIKILSWNYDNQFEHACSEIQDSSSKVNILNAENYLKFNGRATYHPLHTNNNPELKHEDFEYEEFNQFRKKTNKIDFAWEEEYKSKFYERLENLKKIKSNLNQSVLVLVGYSFPFINHSYDFQILNTLKPKVIYYQNIVDQTEVLKERFDIPFKFINDYSRFYIPHEMYEGFGNKNGKYFLR